MEEEFFENYQKTDNRKLKDYLDSFNNNEDDSVIEEDRYSMRENEPRL